MATSAKIIKSKPPTISNREWRLAPRRGTATPSRRSEPSGSPGLVRRVRAILSGAKRNANPSPAESLAAALERAAGGATARAALTKDRLGIVGGGAGAVTAAETSTQPRPERAARYLVSAGDDPGVGDTRQSLETIAEPSATAGGNHGDSQGPDPATAA
jgi:hypothetical protein